MAVGRLGDRDVIVSGGGPGDATVRIWDTHGDPVGEPLTGHTGWVGAVAVGRLGDRRHRLRRLRRPDGADLGCGRPKRNHAADD